MAMAAVAVLQLSSLSDHGSRFPGKRIQVPQYFLLAIIGSGLRCLRDCAPHDTVFVLPPVCSTHSR